MTIYEYSLNAHRNLDKSKKYIYNGPMKCYIKENNLYKNVITGNVSAKSNIKNLEVKKNINKSDKIKKQKELLEEKAVATLSLVSQNVSGNVSATASTEYGTLINSLPLWGTSTTACQSDSAAIVLKYMISNYKSYFITSANDANGTLQNYLINSRYIPNGPLSSYDLVYGCTYQNVAYKGMIAYINSRSLGNYYSVNKVSYSFSTIKSLINSNYPVSIGVSTDDINPDGWSEAHEVTVNSYSVGYDGVPFVRVNDSFGSNVIWVNASASYYTGQNMWYIKRK